MKMLQLAKPEINLPSMLEKIKKALEEAKAPAEFLEVRARAIFAGDIAKKRADMAKNEAKKDPKFKEAYDEIIKISYQLEEDALLLRHKAEICLANEYDNGVEKGRYAPQGKPSEKAKTAEPARFTEKPKMQNELGIKHQDMSNYRKSAKVEREFPGEVEKEIKQATARGEEPKITKVRKVVTDLFQKVTKNKNNEREKSKAEKQKTKEEKEALHQKIDEDTKLNQFEKDFLKGVPTKVNIDTFTVEWIRRLEKEKRKLEEMMLYHEYMNIYTSRIELPKALGEMGDYFLECAKILKNREHVPNMKELREVNPIRDEEKQNG